MTFDVMDSDGNGFVTREELKSMLYGLGEIVNDDYIEDMISKADLNRDGKIQFSRSRSAANAIFGANKRFDNCVFSYQSRSSMVFDRKKNDIK